MVKTEQNPILVIIDNESVYLKLQIIKLSALHPSMIQYN